MALFESYERRIDKINSVFYNSGGVAMPIQPQVVFSLDLGF